MALTRRQQEVYDFIRDHLRRFGYPPTVRDIGKAVGLASPSTVHAHLANLERMGLLRRDPAKPRAMEVLAEEGTEPAPRPLPLLGAIAAGEPILAEQNIEAYVPVPAACGGGQGDYLLRVRGESMREAGILDGDLVVVRQQRTAQNGEIVVALIGEEATVKRFYKDRETIRLEPANPDYKPILSREVEVIGKVVGLLRRVG